MHYPVITISREYGSGGRAIGERLAKELGVPFYDKELIFMAAKESGLCENILKNFDEKPRSLLYSIAMDSYMFALPGTGAGDSLEQQVYLATFNTIRHIADQGPCVIIGRCSDYILKGQDDVVNVFVYAPTEVRIKTIMEKMNLSERHAAEVIRDYDNALHRRYKYITGTYRGDRHNRHLLVDSSVLGWEKTAKFIKSFVEMCFEET